MTVTFPRQVNVTVERGIRTRSRACVSQKTPGKVRVDTDGVAASIIVDGVEAGKAPGEVHVPPGERTITLRAPRYLDQRRERRTSKAAALVRI